MIDRDAIAREQARLLLGKGMSHAKTAEATGLTKGVVRNIARSVDRTDEDKEISGRIERKEACSFCGSMMANVETMGRPRRFCSDYCRRQYWRLHRAEQTKKADKLFIRTCAYCGKGFQIYGKSERKYCCREHYRLHFYGADLDKSEA